MEKTILEDVMFEVREELFKNAPRFKEGDKVRFHPTKIYEALDYKDFPPAYKRFINKAIKNGSIFTIKYDKDPNYLREPIILLCFEEDHHEPQWLNFAGFLEAV